MKPSRSRASSNARTASARAGLASPPTPPPVPRIACAMGLPTARRRGGAPAPPRSPRLQPRSKKRTRLLARHWRNEKCSACLACGQSHARPSLRRVPALHCGTRVIRNKFVKRNQQVIMKAAPRALIHPPLFHARPRTRPRLCCMHTKGRLGVQSARRALRGHSRPCHSHRGGARKPLGVRARLADGADDAVRQGDAKTSPKHGMPRGCHVVVQ